MPYFTPRVAGAVEAYQMPREGADITDGMRLFLQENGISESAVKRNVSPSYWVLLTDPSDGVGWGSMTDDEFRITYKPLEK